MKKFFSNKRRIKYFIISALVIFISCIIVVWFNITGFLRVLAIFIPYFIFDTIWTKYYKDK
ncbi:hypothetical protein Clocl_3482 [Acetivibrio clariflavus DSM 19732]|uniref:DUF2061 domain-containing protein n=1 Tax=Acetivibrio clariflavus (strain DSM 19732 / NBRC 101661 / EBR45) TaxID=720554 RepID=G8LYH6_ACECE|nr:hypothetical protein Clocl_3482 [Acetivibrio clariflavus DSM 19732]